MKKKKNEEEKGHRGRRIVGEEGLWAIRKRKKKEKKMVPFQFLMIPRLLHSTQPCTTSSSLPRTTARRVACTFRLLPWTPLAVP
jgi:hypothetical protein